LELPRKERAFIVAAIELKIEAEKKKEREIERRKPKKRR